MRTPRSYYRLALGTTLATVLFLIWGIGALGLIGAGGRADRVYVVVLAVLAVGTLLARLRPRGMAVVLLATALAQALVAGVALLTGLRHTEGASVVDILGVNAMYAGLFALSAWLFRRSAEQHPSMSR